jgi:glycosyltransferase involved in cell wall biosynthesis
MRVQISPAPGYFNPIFTWKAIQFVKDQGIDLIHFHRSANIAAFAAIRNVPLVLTQHIASNRPKKDLFHRWVYGRLNLMLAITPQVRDCAWKALPISQEKISVLPYGIDADNLLARRGDPVQTRRSLNLPEDALVIGLVGRLDPPKGQAVLLKAFATLCHQNLQLYLLLVGGTDQHSRGYDHYLENLARELGIAERVRFTGFQADTAPFHACLDLFVLASDEETFGLVLLEAMAQGKPIIATNAGGVTGIIQDGVNGLLIAPRDELALAQALTRMIEDENLRRRLAEAGAKSVREKYTLSRHLGRLEKHFTELIQR